MKKPKLVDVDSIDLLGKKADEKKLALYAEQNGADAIEFLERAIRDGSVGIRAAAVASLAKLDAAKALSLVVDALDALGKKPPKKERRALLSCLASIGSTDAMAALFARESDNALLFVDNTALASLVKKAETLGEPLARQVRYEALHRGILEDEALLVAIVRDATAEVSDRKVAAGTLLKLRSTSPDALAAIVAADLDAGDVVRASMRLDPVTTSSGLARKFRAEPGQRASIIAALRDVPATEALDVLADAALDVSASDASSSLALLTALKTDKARTSLLAWAARIEALDDTGRRVLHALGALGDARATPILVGWLEKPAGKEIAPLLLTAIGSVGRMSDVAKLEALAAADPTRVAFYRSAIGFCAQRA